MKKICTLSFLLVSLLSFAQKEGQDFCDGDKDGSYFPFIKKKKLLWSRTYYFEESVGEKILNGKKYNTYRQTWENGTIDYLYLREEDGKILEYEECCTTETVRYDEFFEPGHSWASEDKKATYTLLSYDTELETPYCKYKHLMAVEAKYATVTYIFYYLKGYGYVGAKTKDIVISAATPEW